MDVIKVSPDKDGKLIVRLYGVDHQIVVVHEAKKAAKPKTEPTAEAE